MAAPSSPRQPSGTVVPRMEEPMMAIKEDPLMADNDVLADRKLSRLQQSINGHRLRLRVAASDLIGKSVSVVSSDLIRKTVSMAALDLIRKRVSMLILILMCILIGKWKTSELSTVTRVTMCAKLFFLCTPIALSSVNYYIIKNENYYGELLYIKYNCFYFI